MPLAIFAAFLSIVLLQVPPNQAVSVHDGYGVSVFISAK
jgi:hypothetical protein